MRVFNGIAGTNKLGMNLGLLLQTTILGARFIIRIDAVMTLSASRTTLHPVIMMPITLIDDLLHPRTAGEVFDLMTDIALQFLKMVKPGPFDDYEPT